MTAAETYLHSLPRFADQGAVALKPGLERIHALLEAMGHPEERFTGVHVAGTNGKGSTASMMAAVGTALGQRVGLHTSPHVFRLTERMRLDGQPAPTAWLDDAVARYRDAFEVVQPSFFEATVALSFRYFADEHVDLAVVEVGLGGRLDATNVLTPALCLITSIGLDHTDVLGGALPEIAREKAGIIKPGVPVLTSATQPEVLAVVQQVAAERRAPFEAVHATVQATLSSDGPEGLCLDVQTPVRRYDELCVGLPGRYQRDNAMLAIRAAETLFEGAALPDALRLGLREVRRLSGLRGRLEVLQYQPFVVADVAHNADGIAHALAFVQKHRGRGTLYVLLGLMRDKDVDRIARVLAEAGAIVYPIELNGDRAWPAAALAGRLQASHLAITGGGRVAEGLAWFRAQSRPDDALLITGSHQVVAAIPDSWWPVRAY